MTNALVCPTADGEASTAKRWLPSSLRHRSSNCLKLPDYLSPVIELPEVVVLRRCW